MQSTIERAADSPSVSVSGSATDSLRPRPCPFQVLEPADVSFGWSNGAGTPHPEVPTSQRQYDGENPFENCEPWYLP